MPPVTFKPHSPVEVRSAMRTSSSLENLSSLGYTIPSSCRPPPASVSKNLGRLMFCQVCGHLIEIPLSYSKLVVLCDNCRESTVSTGNCCVWLLSELTARGYLTSAIGPFLPFLQPSRPPPSGRRFFRCPCGRLILVPMYVPCVNCPRPGCRRLLLLPATKAAEFTELTRTQSAQAATDMRGGTPVESGLITTNWPNEGIRPIELRCGYCYYRFFAPGALRLTSDAKCPQCKRLTSVGPDFARIRASRLLIYAVLAFTAAIIPSVVTYVYREEIEGHYCSILGLGLAGLIMSIKSIQYYRMPVSRIVIGGYEI
ncbi:hypothetical protein T265_11868 [Opisthorchis viverrini]|uniref:Phosphatidylinositol-4,5-bisphosphate 4-phosphatase n=1 Tax=Opisthorchis viverrini TaxID=6198 RepID=A0A074ZVW5_OPIVI|nr:hypothetical protein T265_11868 [Opisthorchis viverrini]KER19324.1 hypothetical protein T265_11868 [Opisthorchis viverrini]